MMKRLEDQGLLENTQARSKRVAKAWRLTEDGETMIDATRSRGARGTGPARRPGGAALG